MRQPCNDIFFCQVTRSPKLGRPRNSPANMHVRRKLPLSKFDDDDEQVSELFRRVWTDWTGGMKHLVIKCH